MSENSVLGKAKRKLIVLSVFVKNDSYSSINADCDSVAIEANPCSLFLTRVQEERI
jgi:hypothetical protein